MLRWRSGGVEGGIAKSWERSSSIDAQEHIRTNYFNVNVRSDLEFVVTFCFKIQHIGTVCKNMCWKVGKNREKLQLGRYYRVLYSFEAARLGHLTVSLGCGFWPTCAANE